MRKLILMILLAVVSSRAMAEWVMVGSSGGDMTTYVSPATIHKDGNIVKMWYMHDFKSVQESAGDRFLSITFQGEYDCKEVKSRILSYTWYSGNKGGGNVKLTETSPANWNSVFPGSTEETVFKYACGGKKWWHF